LSTIYYCTVQNSVNITSLDAAQVDNITGTHLTGKNNDNVEGIYVPQGQVHYFPRGLNTIFRNLKGIYIQNTGLKEIHQRDLKYFPKLMVLDLISSNLEIIEENLFEFNPDLEQIYLQSNKITHIDPNVFDNLIKVKTLNLLENTCINTQAYNNPTGVQNVIKTAKAQCTNSDYLNLEQKVKILEIESKKLNSENFKQKLDNLVNEIKNSRFSNFFQEILHGLNATAIIKETISKVNDVNDKLVVQDSKISGIDKKMTNINDTITTINNNYQDLKTRFINLMNTLKSVFNTAN